MKRALLIGVDSYDHCDDLRGCVNDVNSLLPLLSRNQDDSPNFDCQLLHTGQRRADRRDMLDAIDRLLAPGADVALLYFAGHGARDSRDVVLVSQDGQVGDFGVSLTTLLAKIQSSPVLEVILILDCCFSGAAGSSMILDEQVAAVRNGVSILTASRGDQNAAETNGRGAFSTFLCGALEGGAADVLGKITVASVYAYLSESFGPWDQRPTYKANVNRLHDLRRCVPAVPFADLRKLAALFPYASYSLALDPSYEPTVEPRHAEHEADFLTLQRCKAAKLIEAVGAEHMYFAAMESAACRLTPLGRLYRDLAEQKRL